MNEKLKNLFSPVQNDEDLQRQVTSLRSMVIRLCQEVDAMKNALTENNCINGEKINEHAKKNLLKDHSSIGPHPWMAYSYYRFIVEEHEYLRDHLGFSDEKVAEFSREVKHVETLT